MALVQFAAPDATTFRDNILRTLKNGLIRRGVSSPNVGPGSDFFVLATALGNELAVVSANAIVKCDEQMPDTAVDDGLLRIATLFGMSKQPAAGSFGNIVLSNSAASPIASGTQLTDTAGLLYEVSVGGTYAVGASVPVDAIATGKATDHPEGDVLRWVNAPPFCDDKVEVDVGGLTNGHDADDDESLRARVLATFQNPPGSGNWEDVAEKAEQSAAQVQKAFVHPAIQGPGTQHVAVVAAPTATNKNRDVAALVMSGSVVPYMLAKVAQHSLITTTTVANVPTSVAFALALPEAPTANPAGPGGGWLNGSPWPAPDGVSTFKCAVTAVTSSTSFTVDAATSPDVGVSRVAWLSPLTWTLYTGLITAVTGTSGAYVVTVDNAFTGITTGAYIWPECTNAQAYVDAVLSAYGLMGPGEKSTNASALIRGFRHPLPGNSWPFSLGPHLARAVSNAGTEVDDVQFFYRTDGTTTLTTSSGQVKPQVPGAVADPPNIFTPNNIAFYRVP